MHSAPRYSSCHMTKQWALHAIRPPSTSQVNSSWGSSSATKPSAGRIFTYTTMAIVPHSFDSIQCSPYNYYMNSSQIITDESVWETLWSWTWCQNVVCMKFEIYDTEKCSRFECVKGSEILVDLDINRKWLCRMADRMFAVMVYAFNLCHLAFDATERCYENRKWVSVFTKIIISNVSFLCLKCQDCLNRMIFPIPWHMSSSDACICSLVPSWKPIREHSSKWLALGLSTGTFFHTAISENAFDSLSFVH
jgi:hypothetical protein